MRFILIFVAVLVALATPANAQDCGLYQYRAVITKVYDGDTVTADIDLGFNTWRHNQKLRLYGVDTPEVRGKERPEGLVARDALRELILDKEVTVCTIKDKTGKYGRYLARIYIDNINVNAWLIMKGYAEPYNPGS
jgi:micrococcal nuclease